MCVRPEDMVLFLPEGSAPWVAAIGAAVFAVVCYVILRQLLELGAHWYSALTHLPSEYFLR